MTVATVKSVATRFLESEAPEVLVLKGAWGVGKTYFWHRIVEDIKESIKLPNYSYVSLFGVGSFAELRLAVFANTRSTKMLGEKLDAKKINKEWAVLSGGMLRSLTPLISRMTNLPYVKNLSIGLDTIAPHLIKNTIVCFDDFERLGNSFKPDELLGFISALKEEKGCKIALIFNEDELGPNRDVYKKYREKVVDIELLFAPSAFEAAELAFPLGLPMRDLVTHRATSLEIKNIRILRKIASLTSLIHKSVRDLHPNVMQQSVATLVLVAWSYYDVNGKKPTIEFIREWNNMLWAFKENEGEEKDPQRVEWAGVLRKYDFGHMDEFDLAICKVVECGYVEETGLLEAAQKLDVQFHANDLDNSFTAAWKLFHNTFNDNTAELISALTDSFKKSIKQISPLNLNGTAKLLRELNCNDLANELIDIYILTRGDEKELFDLEAYPFSSDINDPVVTERFSQQNARLRQAPTLLEVVKSISQKRGWSVVEMQVLEKATADDFYALFKFDHANDLSVVIQACLQFDGFAGHKAISQKARAALERIGRECHLNAMRVKRYGVTLSKVGEHAAQSEAGSSAEKIIGPSL